MSMFVRTKKKIASKLSKTKSVQTYISGLLGESGEIGVNALLDVIKLYDSESVMKEMKDDMFTLITKGGIMHTDKVLDEVKARQHLEKPTARLFELLMQGTLEVSTASQLRQVEDMKHIVKGGKKDSSGRRFSLSASENRDVAVKRTMRRKSARNIDSREIPEQNLIYKTQLALTKVVTLLDAILTRAMSEKNRGKMKEIGNYLKKKSFLTFLFDSPVCLDQRNALYHALDDWYKQAGFQQSEESKEEERRIWRMKYERIKDSLRMRDFLQQAKYQQYLKSYLCEAQASLADSVSAWIAVERFKETSSAETLKSRAPGIFKNFIKGKNTGIDDDEVVAIAKKIDENKISRQLFDTGMQQIVEKINFCMEDFKASKVFAKFKVDLYRFTPEEAGLS